MRENVRFIVKLNVLGINYVSLLNIKDTITKEYRWSPYNYRHIGKYFANFTESYEINNINEFNSFLEGHIVEFITQIIKSKYKWGEKCLWKVQL